MRKVLWADSVQFSSVKFGESDDDGDKEERKGVWSFGLPWLIGWC